MKRLLKYTIAFLVVIMLVPLTTNAQTIKRSKQKTEQTQKSNNSTKSGTTKSKSTKADNQKSNNTSSSKKNKSQRVDTASATQSSSVSSSSSSSKSSQQIKPETRSMEPTTYPVTFSCNVSNADLYIDGNRLGTANEEYHLLPGTYSVIIKYPGYFDNSDEINVTSSTTFHYILVLKSVIKRMIDDMVLVQGGSFKMGATREQGKCSDNEKPTHKVTLSDYYISKYEVTQELWIAVMGKNPSLFKGNLKQPVERVSWNDCQTFITKLNELTGKRFRLPTEAEWEYAARGGNKSQGYKYSGSNSLDDVAWFYDNSGRTTHPVGQKSPNELGLYDMSGNVWEWCQDWLGSYSKESQTNPQVHSGTHRVYRGGGWDIFAGSCRVSNRSGLRPDNQNDYLGLRLAASSL